MKRFSRLVVQQRQPIRLVLIVAAGAALRIYLVPFPASYDLLLIRQFSDRLAEVGPRDYYLANFDHYLPGYLYVLWAIGEAHKAFFPNVSDATYLQILKLPANLFDIATAYLIYRILSKRISPDLAL